MSEQHSQLTAGRTYALIAILGVASLGAGGYALHERNLARRTAEQNAQITASLQTTNAQVQQLTAKLNELTAPKPAPQVEAKAPVRVVVRPKAAVTRRVQRDDPRWKKLQDQLEEQNRAIASTRDDLSTTRTELQGSIARTHEELVVLQRKGERNYYEFDILKSKQFQRSGPVGVRLKKANVKRQYADLELLVDDVSLTQKHVNLLQPMFFYASESDHPVELVINSVTKDRIRGYVSAPKYRRSELAAGGSPANTNVNQPLSEPPQRQRLAAGR